MLGSVVGEGQRGDTARFHLATQKGPKEVGTKRTKENPDPREMQEKQLWADSNGWKQGEGHMLEGR